MKAADTTAYPSYDLKFAVRYTVAGSNNTILYATGTGQVGVGTASPTAMLDVAGATRLRGLGTAGNTNVGLPVRIFIIHKN